MRVGQKKRRRQVISFAVNYNYIKQILIFCVFAFTLPLISVVLIKTITVCQTGPINLILYGYAAFTPTLSAILTIYICEGKKGIGVFLKANYLTKMRFKYIALAVILPIMILSLTKLLTILFVEDASFYKIPDLKQFLIIAWALVAEEMGWRGFLQRRLDRYFYTFFTPLIIGMIWTAGTIISS